MVQNPDVLKKGQKEVDEWVGYDRLPDFDDREHLPYTVALLKETLRWRPVTPLGIAVLSSHPL